MKVKSCTSLTDSIVCIVKFFHKQDIRTTNEMESFPQ